MAYCNRQLNKHIECVKANLREGSDWDQCAETRHAFADCKQAPPTRTEKEVIRWWSTQAQPLDFHNHKQQSVFGVVAPEPWEADSGIASGPKGPRACEMELNIHGQCIENFLRRTVSKSNAGWFANDVVDRCPTTRARFDRCYGNRAVAEGREKDPTVVEPLNSPKTASQFSVSGRW